MLLHAPLASQVPAQRPLGSAAFLTATHAWLVVSQTVQVAVQSALVQHPLLGMQVVEPPVVQDFVVPVHE